jgi:hypothetical protein
MVFCGVALQQVSKRMDLVINSKKKSFVVFLATFGLLSPTFLWILVNNPYQSGYFNRLAGNPRNLTAKWGGGGFSANTEALRWILTNDSKALIVVDSIGDNPIKIGAIMLKDSERTRFCFKRYDPICKARTVDYLINPMSTGINLNARNENYAQYNLKKGNFSEVYEIKVANRSILKVLKNYER